MVTRYDKYLDGKSVITMGGVDNTIWADTKDYAEFVKLVSRFKENQDLEPFVKFAMKLIKKGTDQSEVAEPKFDEALERYLWKNVTTLPDELTIAFGLTSREKLDQLRKDAEEAMLKKKDQ